MRMRRLTGLALATVFALDAQSAVAAPLDVRYIVTSVNGGEAPPPYILRLDGFFGGDEVTFGADDVFLDVFTDGSAHLFGTISVVEVDDGPPGGFASTWSLNVMFDPGTGPDSAFQYFHLNPQGMELVNQADANDFADLFEFPSDGSKPYRLGVGAISDYKCVAPDPCLSATGWLAWQHGNYANSGDTADFLMEIQPIPEPSAAVLFGVGALVVGSALRRKSMTD